MRIQNTIKSYYEEINKNQKKRQNLLKLKLLRLQKMILGKEFRMKKTKFKN